MNPDIPHADSVRNPWRFLLVVGALALPIWLASDRLGLISGLRIPVSDLALAFTPMAAALWLAGRREGPRSALALLAAAFDVTSIRSVRWAAAAVLLAPALYLATYAAMRASGAAGADATAAPRLFVLFGVFLLLAAGEEVGWTGYALRPLQARWGPVGASVILAVPWWLGHLPSMQAIGATPADMGWWALAAVSLRILFTWLYNGAGGSLLAAVLFHTLLNLSRIVTYPADGSHYDSAYQAVGSVVAAIAAVVVLANSASLRRWPVRTG